MHFRRLLPALLCCLPSCFIDRASDDEPLYPSMLAGLRPGLSTAAQVVEKLGAPVQVVRLNRRSAYRFEHRMDKSTFLVLIVLVLGGTDHRSDRVWAFFDEHDVLTHFATTYGAHRTEYSLPWEDIHDEVGEREKDEAWRAEHGPRTESGSQK
jgi:hypothetical protein